MKVRRDAKKPRGQSEILTRHFRRSAKEQVVERQLFFKMMKKEIPYFEEKLESIN